MMTAAAARPAAAQRPRKCCPPRRWRQRRQRRRRCRRWSAGRPPSAGAAGRLPWVRLGGTATHGGRGSGRGAGPEGGRCDGRAGLLTRLQQVISQRRVRLQGLGLRDGQLSISPCKPSERAGAAAAHPQRRPASHPCVCSRQDAPPCPLREGPSENEAVRAAAAPAAAPSGAAAACDRRWSHRTRPGGAAGGQRRASQHRRALGPGTCCSPACGAIGSRVISAQSPADCQGCPPPRVAVRQRCVEASPSAPLHSFRDPRCMPCPCSVAQTEARPVCRQCAGSAAAGPRGAGAAAAAPAARLGQGGLLGDSADHCDWGKKRQKHLRNAICLHCLSQQEARSIMLPAAAVDAFCSATACPARAQCIDVYLVAMCCLVPTCPPLPVCRLGAGRPPAVVCAAGLAHLQPHDLRVGGWGPYVGGCQAPAAAAGAGGIMAVVVVCISRRLSAATLWSFPRLLRC